MSTTYKTIQTLRAGDRFTATATNGAEVTLTVAEDRPGFPAIQRILDNGKTHPQGERVFVDGLTGCAIFHAGDTATVTL